MDTPNREVRVGDHLREDQIMSLKHLTTAAILTATAAVPANAQHSPAKNIVETAVAAGQFKTLAAALQAAGLVDALSGEGPFTVFAPTDEAFAKLPPGTVEALLKDKAKLTKVLTYHVVSGNVPATEVVKLTSATTLSGGTVKLSVMDGKVMVNNAHVIQADVKASNGVIHVVDTVLLPK